MSIKLTIAVFIFSYASVVLGQGYGANIQLNQQMPNSGYGDIGEYQNGMQWGTRQPSWYQQQEPNWGNGWQTTDNVKDFKNSLNDKLVTKDIDSENNKDSVFNSRELKIKFPNSISNEDKEKVIKSWKIIKKTCPTCSTAGTIGGEVVITGGNTSGSPLFGNINSASTLSVSSSSDFIEISQTEYRRLIDIERKYKLLVK